MEAKKSILLAVFVLTAILPTISFAYTTQIHAPAVIANTDTGTLTVIQLNLTAGNGSVRITGPNVVGNSTLLSAKTAVQAAGTYLGVNTSRYDFTYFIENSINVSGPSGGLALTLLAVYAFKHEQLYNNFTVTGTISGSGAVGAIGGIYDKAGAAKQNGMEYLLVPTVQNGSTEDLLYYIAQQSFNLPVIEVSNLSQALSNASNSNATITRLGLNISQNYNLTSGSAPLMCPCNISYFSQLVNYTFGFVENETSSIPANFSSAASQLLGNIAQDRNIAAKGYLYTGADLAFLDYATAYMLAHAGSYTPSGALSLASNVSDYCSLLSPPQMTTLNYEYVAGGELRQSLAVVNLQTAVSEINSSSSTDSIIEAIGTIAQSQAWCGAANEMYNIASSIGGTPDIASQAMKIAARNSIKTASRYPGPYLSAAMLSYNQSQYAAALYGATYTTAFNSAGLSNYSENTQAQIESMARNATNGVWPTEFANSAMFYLQEAKSSPINSAGYISSAYSLALLADKLSSVNSYISDNLVQNTSQNYISPAIINLLQNNSAQIGALSSSIDGLHTELEFFAVLLLIIIAIVSILFMHLVLVLKKQKLVRHRRR